MRYFLVILVLTFLTYQGKCQDSLKNVVKVSLFSSIDLFNPSVDLSYERFINKKQSVQFLFGYLLPNGEKSHGFKIRTEYRFYTNGSKGLYYAPELFYMHNNYTTFAEFGKQNDTTYNLAYNYVDTFKIDKHVIAITGKLGYEYRYKHFCIDLFTGIGVRFRIVDRYNIIKKNPSDDIVLPRELNIRLINDDAYPITVNLSFNIKVGFNF